MYINPFEIKLHADKPEEVLGQQLKGWVYESHAWVVVSEEHQTHKICRWCGAQSMVDMVVDKDDSEKAFCHDNPVISTFFLGYCKRQC